MAAATTAAVEPARAIASAGRLVALDALRFVAVLLVLGRHIERPEAGVAAPIAAVLAPWHAIGWIGVDLFFVLSGFLVAGLLFVEHQRHGDVRAWRFLGRRGCKIYPGFYALLLVSWLWLGRRLPGEAFAWEALFVQNYLEPVVWNHTWSLAVEEHFYLVLALGLGLRLRLRPGPTSLRGLPLVVGTVCVAVLSMRIAAWLRHPGNHLLFPTHLRLDALTFGVGLAYAWHCHRERTLRWIARWRPWLAFGGVLLLTPCLLLAVETSAVVNTVGLTCNYLGFGALLLVCLTSARLPRAAVVRALAAVGFYSYSIYLWHMPVQKAVHWWLEPTVGHGAGIALYLLAALLVGIVMAKVIELPFLALRDRLLPSRSLPLRAAAPVAAPVAVTSMPVPASPDVDAVPPAIASAPAELPVEPATR